MHEMVLILDEDFKVLAANESFYETFKVKLKDTEGKVVYNLGNGQWDIPALRKLLEDIVPKHTFFKGFQVAHEFPSIGRKVMILNARQIYIDDDDDSEQSKAIILLAMEDVTEMMVVADMLSEHSKTIESKLNARIANLAQEIRELKKNK